MRLLVPSPENQNEWTGVVTPLIPKHFSPGRLAINIPKRAEDLINSLLLKGSFSRVCLQIPASRQHLCEQHLALPPKGQELGWELSLLRIFVMKFLSFNRPSLSSEETRLGVENSLLCFWSCWSSSASPATLFWSCGHRRPLELSHAYNASLCSSSASSTIPWDRLIRSSWLGFQFT